jgi:recombinational DNA repair protein (RecF pathway)
MGVFCDVCAKPLSPNDDRIYTKSGGALCPEHQLERKLERKLRQRMHSDEQVIRIVIEVKVQVQQPSIQ